VEVFIKARQIDALPSAPAPTVPHSSTTCHNDWRCMCTNPETKRLVTHRRSGDNVCEGCGVVVGRVQDGLLFEKHDEVNTRRTWDANNGLHFWNTVSGIERDPEILRRNEMEDVLLSWMHHARIPPGPLFDEAQRIAYKFLHSGKCKKVVVAAAFAHALVGKLPDETVVQATMRTLAPMSPLDIYKAPAPTFKCTACGQFCDDSRSARLHCTGNPIWRNAHLVAIQKRPRIQSRRSGTGVSSSIGTTSSSSMPDASPSSSSLSSSSASQSSSSSSSSTGASTV